MYLCLAMLLLRSLWIGFCVPDLIRLATFGSLFLRTQHGSPGCCSDVAIWQPFGSFVRKIMQELYTRSYRTAMLSGDVSADCSAGDGTECGGDDVEARECEPKCAVDAKVYDYCCAEVDGTDMLSWGRSRRSGVTYKVLRTFDVDGNIF